MASGPVVEPRLVFVDSLRGFALLGVYWANLLLFGGIDYLSDAQRVERFPGAADRLSFWVERLVVETKFMGLFSFLFGISFWLFLQRAQARPAGGTALFYRRIGWLFLIGAAHGWLLWCFDVLRFYALWAVLLPLFVAVRPRRLLAAALGAAVLLPALVAGLRAWLAAMPSAHAAAASPSLDELAIRALATGSYLDVLRVNWLYDWFLTLSVGQLAYQVAIFGRLLLGLFVARTCDLGNPGGAHRRLLLRLLPITATIGIAGNLVDVNGLWRAPAGAVLHAIARRLLVEGGYLGLTLTYAGVLALLFAAARTRPLVALLAPLGRMALTWYLLQTLAGIWLFYGFAPGPHLFLQIGPGGILVLGIAGWALQVGLARWWMRHFRFGPAEWIWRALTYGGLPPFRRAAAVIEPAM